MMVAFVLGEVAAYQKDMTVWFIITAVFFVFAVIKRAEERVESNFQTDAKYIRKRKNAILCRFLLLFLCLLAGWGRMKMEMRPDALEQYVRNSEGAADVRLLGTVDSFSEKNGWCSVILGDVYMMPHTKETADEMNSDEIKKSGLKKKFYSDNEKIKVRKVIVSFESALSDDVALTESALTESDERFHSGSRIYLTGTAEFPEKARNPGQFSYWIYYRGLGIRTKVTAYHIDILEEKASPLVRQTERFRRYAGKVFQEICDKDDAGIFMAVLLGDKSELSQELKECFQDNGIAHILAVSGLHVSLIGMSLYGIMRYFGVSYAMAGICASALLTFYGFVTGFGASVFRAVFMVEVSCLASYLGRSYDLLSALSLSLILQAWQSPYLLFSAGLQLSYGAVAAIGVETELMREKIRRRKEQEENRNNACSFSNFKVNALNETIAISMAIQIYTMPIQLYHYYSFPLLGIVLNLVVIPLLAYAAGSGILALGIYSVGFPGVKLAAAAATGPGHYIFHLYEWLCIQAEQFPFHTLIPGRPEIWKIIVFYLILLIRYVYIMGNLEERLSLYTEKITDMALTGAAVLFLMINPVHGLRVCFLDVGQGDGVLMRTNEATILSDCGSSQDKKIGKNVLIPFLKSQGIGRLDWILVSHADADHINGIEWLLKEEPDIRVDNLALPAAGKGQEAYEKIEALAIKRGAKVYYLHRDQQIQTKKLTLKCIYPEEGEKSEEEKNSHSLVFYVTYENFNMLLTGDIGTDDEREILLMERGFANNEDGQKTDDSRPVTFLKAAHHGSGGSSSEDFLNYYMPEYTVLSYGDGNTYGHPAQETLERLSHTGTKLWRTADSGAVNVWTDGKRMKIKGFIEN